MTPTYKRIKIGRQVKIKQETFSYTQKIHYRNSAITKENIIDLNLSNY